MKYKEGEEPHILEFVKQPWLVTGLLRGIPGKGPSGLVLAGTERDRAYRSYRKRCQNALERRRPRPLSSSGILCSAAAAS